jgi:glycosyltransferase involved in cell wall biosynthesis
MRDAGARPEQAGVMSADRIPAVSVCVPLYNKERFVAETIRSVLDQTFADFELVVLDNASADRSAEIVAGFDDPRIRLRHNPVTVPGAENFARVVDLSGAPLVKMTAADDRLHPTALESMVEAMADPAVALVSCRQNMIGSLNEIVYADRSLRHPDLIGHQRFVTVLRRVVRHVANPIGALVNVMFRRAAYEAAGGVPDAPFTTLDLAMWMVILEHGDFVGLDRTLCDFRIADGSASADHGRAGIDDQVRYIDDLVRHHRTLIRPTDLAYKTLRTPLMRARHQMIVSAAGPVDSTRAQIATKALALSRPLHRSAPAPAPTETVPRKV